jgi:peptidoglycan biosynthesis protein MviN/MurJ (putative lipid II flippase)
LLARVSNYSNVSLALGQPRVPLIAALIALFANAVLSTVAVRTVGLSGPALANVTAIAISTVYTLWAIRTRLAVPWGRLFPLGRYLRTLGAAGVSVLPACSILLFDFPAWVTVLAAAVVYLAVYGAVCHAGDLINSEDRSFLRGIFNLGIVARPARPGAPG